MRTRKGYLVALPPGAGKTRVVLQKIKKLARGKWKNAINNLLVLGPNTKLKRIWLREIALTVADKRSLSQQDQREIRTYSISKLTKRLKNEHKIRLKFKTYQQIKKCRNFNVLPFIVLDEWHRLNIIERGGPHILSKSRKGPYGNHTFFVSATPLNPVLEQEAENIMEEPKDDTEIITESRKKALDAIIVLLGNNNCIDICNKPFAEAVTKLGVKWITKDTGWKEPKRKRNGNNDETDCFRSKELEYFRQASNYEDNSNWKSKEAAWAIGLVRTNYKKHTRSYELIKSKKGKIKKSFRFNYVDPYIATGHITDAGKWLLERHTRVQRLIERLKVENIIKEDKVGKYSLTKKKCLIFCIHQGVARGLQYALSRVIDNPNNGNIACTVHEFDKDIEDSFNTKEKPYILIATDKMSESIDLHKACTTLIHYELPWSPLRLFQRVGRLTRKHSKGNFKGTYVYHIIIPGSVEEERINRLIRRTELLAKEGAWPKELHDGTEINPGKIARSLIGDGPSLHLEEETI